MSVIATCPGCGKKNRLPATARQVACGHCHRPFTLSERTRAALGNRADIPDATVTRPDLEDEDEDEPTHACNDEDCGWEGMAEDLDGKRCPDCGKRTHKLGEEDE